MYLANSGSLSVLIKSIPRVCWSFHDSAVSGAAQRRTLRFCSCARRTNSAMRERSASGICPLPFQRENFVQMSLTDRKSTRLNSSHVSISYAVFCLKKKKVTLQHELKFEQHLVHRP